MSSSKIKGQNQGPQNSCGICLRKKTIKHNLAARIT